MASRMIEGNGWALHCRDAGKVAQHYDRGTFDFALFSTPYPQTRGSGMKTGDYRRWFRQRLWALAYVMSNRAVIMHNIWFPRTDQGWYDKRIFGIPALYSEYNYNMVDTYIWDKKNAPPAGNHERHDRNEYEFIFAFARQTNYVHNKYRGPYKPKSIAKAASGNYRKESVAGNMAGGHDKLHPEGAAQGNIYRFSPTGGQEVHRPRVKDGVFPLSLAERAILQFTNPGDTVLDPFCGSGTTLVAAIRLGRKAVGFDVNEENIATAAAWLQEVADDIDENNG